MKYIKMINKKKCELKHKREILKTNIFEKL